MWERLILVNYISFPFTCQVNFLDIFPFESILKDFTHKKYHFYF
nr:MAG TPA: hypothetical protein [Caudoviricetes sp.]